MSSKASQNLLETVKMINLARKQLLLPREATITYTYIYHIHIHGTYVYIHYIHTSMVFCKIVTPFIILAAAENTKL
jgi:hypothetical protein